MKTYTNQEGFDVMVRGFEKQGWRPALECGKCLWYCSDGRKCAVGHLVPHAVAVENPDSDYTDAFAYIKANEEFLEEAQYAHDGAACPQDLKEAMAALAARIGLTWPEVPQ